MGPVVTRIDYHTSFPIPSETNHIAADDDDDLCYCELGDAQVAEEVTYSPLVTGTLSSFSHYNKLNLRVTIIPSVRHFLTDCSSWLSHFLLRHSLASLRCWLSVYCIKIPVKKEN